MEQNIFSVWDDDEEPAFEAVGSLLWLLILQKRERPVWQPEDYVKKKTLQPRKRSKEEWDSIFQFYPTADDG